MRNFWVFGFALFFILSMSVLTSGVFADEMSSTDENEIGANTQTSPQAAFDEFMHAGGSFWRPTTVSHMSATASLGFLDWGVLSATGIFLDLTFMAEYSIEDMVDQPVTVFAQTGLGIHYLDFIESDTNIGLMSIWLGGKYKMYIEDRVPNLALSFIAAIGIGFNDGSDDVGNAQFAGPILLNSGNFSLLFGGLATYMLNNQMGVGGSFMFQFYTFSSGAHDHTEFGALMHAEFLYIVNSEITTHVGLTDNWDNDIDSQNWKFFAQAMMISGFYGQVVIPLEGNGFLIVFMAGYNMTFK